METSFKPSLAKEVTTTIIFGVPFLLLLVIAIIGVTMMENFPNEINYVLIPVIFLSIWMMILSVGKVKNTSYKIDKKFITRRTRFISEIQEDVPFKQVTNIDYSIGWFFDRMFKTGTIKVYTAGSSLADIVISDVKNVSKIYDDMNGFLHLKKSAAISDDGEIKKGEKSELLKRVKPNANLALVSTTYIPFGVMLLFTFGTGIVLLPFFAISGFFTYKAYKKRYYDFYTDKLEYYDGFFTYNKKTVPLERITNVSENQMLLDRIIGTYTINIQTAGSSGAEISITFVKDGPEIAKDLKEVLKKHGRN